MGDILLPALNSNPQYFGLLLYIHGSLQMFNMPLSGCTDNIWTVAESIPSLITNALRHSSPELWYGLFGNSNSWEELVRKPHFSWTATRKSRRSGDLGGQNSSTNSAFPCDLSIAEVEILFRKRQECLETWRFRWLHFPAGRSSPPLASEFSTFHEWISTSTMDMFHGEWKLGTSGLATEVSRSHTLWFFLWGFVKDAVYVPPFPTNLIA